MFNWRLDRRLNSCAAVSRGYGAGLIDVRQTCAQDAIDGGQAPRLPGRGEPCYQCYDPWQERALGRRDLRGICCN